jgi:hypothetical protein
MSSSDEQQLCGDMVLVTRREMQVTTTIGIETSPDVFASSQVGNHGSGDRSHTLLLPRR